MPSSNDFYQRGEVGESATPRGFPAGKRRSAQRVGCRPRAAYITNPKQIQRKLRTRAVPDSLVSDEEFFPLRAQGGQDVRAPKELHIPMSLRW